MRKVTLSCIKTSAITLCVCFAGMLGACDGVTSTFSPYLDQYSKAGSEGKTDLPDTIKAIVLVCDNQTDLNGKNPPNYRFGVEEYNELPDEMKADSPEEVNTIIRITEIHEVVGYYKLVDSNTKVSDAYAIRAYVTVINADTGIIWVKDRMFYNNPPEHVDVLARVPMDQIVDFIREASPG